MPAVLDDLQARGLIHEVTHRDDLAKLLASQVVPVYAGYDPTSSSLHVGNLVPTILLKRFQLAGHKPIVVVGGATGMIGDPSGKSDERNLLDADTLARNLAGIRTQLSRLLDFDDPVTGAVMTNNHDWTRDVRYLDFLRDIGKHLTVNYMMAKDSVKNRAGEGGGATLLIDTQDQIAAADIGASALLRAGGATAGGGAGAPRPDWTLADGTPVVLPAVELAGKAFVDLVAKKDRGVIAGVLECARREGPQETVFSALRLDGQELTCQVRFTPLHDGTVVATISERQAGISYTEFSYMLLQAFDFVQLARTHRCRLQVGGSDQFGNITAGCELSHKMRGPQLFGLVAPLLLDSSGQKMGKTSTGERISLDPSMTSPYDFYQYWFNRSDEEAGRFLRMFSLRPLDELAELERQHDADRSKRLAQRELARAMTGWVHGEPAIVGIEAANRVMFGGTSIKDLTNLELDALARTLPRLDLPRNELAAGVKLIDLFARALNVSKSAAGELIKSGGAYVNDVPIKNPMHQVGLADLATDTMFVVRGGKKKYHLVRVT